MRRVLLISCMLLMTTALAVAQTVTVDNTNTSPNNTTTFNSIMMAIHSFQASGVTTAASPGGVGVNHANTAANVIQVIATGTVYTGITRIDERSTCVEQSLQDQPLKIIGVASGSNDKPIVAPLPDSAISGNVRGMENRTDIDLDIENIIFMYDPACTVAYSYVLSFDRLTVSAGTPSNIIVKDCVFTGADATGKPLVTNADEAFVDRRADLKNPTGGAPGRTVGIIPDKNEGMLLNFENCVFGCATNGTSSRYCSLYVYFGGTGVSADTSWTETAGVTVKSCTFTYGPSDAIEMQSGGSTINSANQYVNITGSGAVSGGAASGSPTIFANYGITGQTASGSAFFALPSNPTNSPNGVMSGRWDNIWIANMTGPAIQDDVLGSGGTMYWSLRDSIIFKCNTASGGTAIASGWRTTVTPTTDTVSLDNVTIIGGNNDAASTSSIIALTAAADTKAVNVKLNNVIFGRASTALGPVRAINNSTPCVVTVDKSSFINAGDFAMLADPMTLNTGTGSVTATGIVNADPQFRNSDDLKNAKFLVVANPSYVGAGPSGSDLVGGRYFELAPTATPTPIPPAAAHTSWNIYE